MTNDPESTHDPEEAEFYEAHGSPVKFEAPDPARLGARRLLTHAVKDAGTTFQQAGRDGSICLVVLPDASWREVACKEWQWLARSGAPYKDVVQSRYNGADARWAAWIPKEARRSYNKDDGDIFADAVANGYHCIGFACDVSWLPPDLLVAADHRLTMPQLVADDVGFIAKLLCRHEPAETLLPEEAARLTPRLLRLGRRLDQTADGYVRKLRALLNHDAKESATVSGQRTDSPRDAPTLERLHGMDEFVRWGMNVKADLEAFRAGKIAWSAVDNGCLLSGPPGVGKTLAARALATTCKIPLVIGSYSGWLGMGGGHQGDLLKGMNQTFSEARGKAPCGLLIDEVDSFPDRGKITHQYVDWETQVVNGLLALMDGVEARDGVILLAACNHPEKLDPALVRSGRLNRHIRVSLPDRTAIAKILREHLGNDLPCEDLSGAAMAAEGSTGADAERFVRGARRSARYAARDMVMADLLDEIGGADDRSAEDIWIAAVHEAGHVVAAHVFWPGSVQMVSLQNKADRGGIASTNMQTSVYMRPKDMKNRLVFFLAGRAAEHLTFGTPSSGAGGSAESDLAMATKLAAAGDAVLGLDDLGGLVWRGMPDIHRLPAPLVDRVRTRLDEAYTFTLELIRPRLTAVNDLAEALVRRRILDGPEAETIVRRSLGAGGDQP